jgi:hypothetical protein
MISLTIARSAAPFDHDRSGAQSVAHPGPGDPIAEGTAPVRGEMRELYQRPGPTGEFHSGIGRGAGGARTQRLGDRSPKRQAQLQQD